MSTPQYWQGVFWHGGGVIKRHRVVGCKMWWDFTPCTHGLYPDLHAEDCFALPRRNVRYYIPCRIWTEKGGMDERHVPYCGTSRLGKLDRFRTRLGKMERWAWPGGYPIVYLTSAMDPICGECAQEVDFQEEICYQEINWESQGEVCCGCNKELESAYGSPEGSDD